ncbi:MAG: glycosyltransferase family 9 protein [Candidatus Binatia bacterium]
MKLYRLREPQATPEKILVIFPGALGDFICFLPALSALSKVSRLDLFARETYAQLLPTGIRACSLERNEISRLFVEGAERDERLRRFFASYGFVYSWMGSGQPDFVKHLQELSDGRAQIFPFRPLCSGVHMVDYYLSCLDLKHLKPHSPLIPLATDALNWGFRFCRENGFGDQRILILAPGSGAKEKNWPIRYYKVVAQWWEEKIEGNVIVLLGPAEEDGVEIENHWKHGFVVRSLDLAPLAALLIRCEIFLGNDSGVTHLAAALGIKTVALFGPTDPMQWMPRGQNVCVTRLKLECSPCGDSFKKACSHRSCLTALSPSDVIARLEAVLRAPAEFGEVTQEHSLDKVKSRG